MCLDEEISAAVDISKETSELYDDELVLYIRFDGKLEQISAGFWAGQHLDLILYFCGSIGSENAG
jgi:hypothetical protein